MATTLTRLPDVIDAGTTVKFTTSFPDFPASAYTAKLYLAGLSDDAGGIAGTVNGTGFDFVLSSVYTAAIAAGSYTWQILATKTGTNPAEVSLADQGRVLVRANIQTASAGDFQSYEEKAIPILQAAITGRITEAMKGFEVQTPSGAYRVENLSIEELTTELRRCEAAVRQQQNKGVYGPSVVVAFTGTESEA